MHTIAYYLEQAEHKAIEGSEDSTMCVLADRIYNRVVVDRGYRRVVDDSGSSRHRKKESVVDSVTVFRRIGYRSDKITVSYAIDGRPSSYIVKSDYEISGSVVVAPAGTGEDEIRSNIYAVKDSLRKINPDIEIMDPALLGLGLIRFKLCLPSWSQYWVDTAQDMGNMTNVVEIARLLDHVEKKLAIQPASQKLAALLRTVCSIPQWEAAPEADIGFFKIIFKQQSSEAEARNKA